MVSAEDPAQWLVPTRGAKTLPALEILTGRGFITGKSGSGKSNTASVIAEELLENSYNLLIIDTEGEYYGLKEQYQLLHVGNDEELCDVQVEAAHAEKIATIALKRNVPVILDVSDYLDGDEAKALIGDVVRELYQQEKDVRKPFLLMIEEMQEYLPQSGGSDELSEILERVAKRGRKRGLGMLGMSQRPSSVDKDFITQCDWMVWHRLTWKNDIDVVRNILGSEVADEIEELDTGEGYLMTDWDEDVDRVQFKKKRTHDAGATPGLESYERPDLKSVSSDLVREIKASGGGQAALDETADADDIEPETDFDVDDVVSDMDAPDLNGDSPGVQQGGIEPGDDLRSLEYDELLERSTALERRNQLLEDEVTELRSILQTTDGQPSDAAGTGSRDTDRSSRRRGSRATDRNSSPSRPQPPRRPIDRPGVAGNLVEFTAMVVYLFKTFAYRLRLVSYWLRTGGDEEAQRR